MPLTNEQRLRLQEELDRKGLTAKEASLKTKWRTGRRAGRSLNATYLSQVISQKERGAMDIIEWVCEDNGLDFQYIKKGPPPNVKTQKRPDVPQIADMRSQLATDRAQLVRIQRVTKDLEELAILIASALRLHGADPQVAASMAKTILTTWKARQSPD